MDHRLIQPASRDQIVAIIRQRAERANRDLPAHLGQVSKNFSILATDFIEYFSRHYFRLLPS